jgi:DNA-binding response OmpR family regulator
MRVLVAEDERLMADAIAVGLRRRAMAVDVCYDGDAALERVMVHRYDVVILDRDLPQVHGDEVCRRIVAVGGETRVPEQDLDAVNPAWTAPRRRLGNTNASIC